MSIIARRIPYGLGNYHTSTVRAYTVRGGMGAGIFDGGIPSSATTTTLLTQVPVPQPPKPSTDWGELATSLSTMLAPKPGAPRYVQVAPRYTAPAAAAAAAATSPAPSGMSINTMLAIGLGAAGLLAVVMLTRK